MELDSAIQKKNQKKKTWSMKEYHTIPDRLYVKWLFSNSVQDREHKNI